MRFASTSTASHLFEFTAARGPLRELGTGLPPFPLPEPQISTTSSTFRPFSCKRTRHVLRFHLKPLAIAIAKVSIAATDSDCWSLACLTNRTAHSPRAKSFSSNCRTRTRSSTPRTCAQPSISPFLPTNCQIIETRLNSARLDHYNTGN